MARSIMEFLATTIMFGCVSALIFIFLWYLRGCAKKKRADCVSYDVMERSKKLIALRNPPQFQWLKGLTYAGLFYLSTPILIWRYGIYRTLELVVIPFVISFCIPLLFDALFDLEGLSGTLVLISIIRPLGGLYVAVNDLKFRRDALVDRGWRSVDSCQATSGKDTVQFVQDSANF